MKKANAKRRSQNKFNQYTNSLKFENVSISNHALDRFIQRNKLSSADYLREEHRKKLYNKLIHAKLINIHNSQEYYISADEVYVIKPVFEYGKRRKILTTVLLTKEARAYRFGNNIEDIDYTRIGMKPITI